MISCDAALFKLDDALFRIAVNYAAAQLGAARDTQVYLQHPALIEAIAPADTGLR